MLWPSGGRIINEAIERRADKSDAIHAYYAIVAVYFHTWRARDHVAQTHAIAQRAHNRRQINLIFTKYSIFIIDFVFEWKRGFFFSLYRYALSHGYLFNNFNLINCMSNQLIMSVLQWSNASALLYVVSVHWLLSVAPVRLLVQRIVCLFFSNILHFFRTTNHWTLRACFFTSVHRPPIIRLYACMHVMSTD